MALTVLDQRLIFPDPQSALDVPDGLLAVGGDLSCPRLHLAYQQGIFPWFGDDDPILWWSPSQRGILPLSSFHCSKSLKKFIRRHPYRVTVNQAFSQVIKQCANVPRADNGTWITESMVQAYIQAHQQGLAHSIEVWDRQRLVGGLYGIGLNGVFCGESMFHLLPNCSKLAMYWLVQHLSKMDYKFIDCQLLNPYLQQLGAEQISREDFLRRLRDAQEQHSATPSWLPGVLYG